MKLVPVVFALALAAFVSGCSPAVSIRPLYTEDDLKKPIIEPRIEGGWISPDLDKAGTDGELSLKWKIDPPKRTGLSYSVEVRAAKPDPREGEEVTSYNVRLVPIEDKIFFDADFEEQKQGQHKLNRGDIAGLVPAHLIGRVWVQQDFLRIALFDSKWVKDNFPETFRESVDAPDVDISVITGSTGELRKFVLKNGENEKALSYVFYLCRPGTDCPVRAAEDALGRTPDDDDLLDDAASLFLKRGNYARAAALRRHDADLDSRIAISHARLAEALLFNREFVGARREFAVAQKITLGESPTAKGAQQKDDLESAYADAVEGIVWSYFLEGANAEAVNAAKQYRLPKDHASVNPILLSYFSLLRLGRRAEAESLLKEETARLTGPAEELILLLDAQGKVTEGFPYVDSNSESLRRYSFFSGLHDIATGHQDTATRQLGLAAAGGSDSVIALAARIELERLGPKPKK